MVKVYIDGQEGTTGLKILERFKNRSDIELLRIDEDKRKDADERRKLIHSADFTFLCLPDTAAREAVALAEGSNTRIIDASTAHRTNPANCGSRVLCKRLHLNGVPAGEARNNAR